MPETEISWNGIYDSDSYFTIDNKSKHKKISEKKCIDVGGHCWNFHSANECVDEFGNRTGMYYVIYYPNGETQYRTCRHCGKRQQLKPEEWLD